MKENFNKKDDAPRFVKEAIKVRKQKQADVVSTNFVQKTDHAPQIAGINKELGDIYNAHSKKQQPIETVEQFEDEWKQTHKPINTGNRTLRKIRNGVVGMLGALSIFGGKAHAGGDDGKGKKKPPTDAMARVSTKPQGGFTEYGKFGDTLVYQQKKEGDKKLGMAKLDLGAKEDPAYKQWLENQVKEGVTIDELIKNRYISNTPEDTEPLKKIEDSVRRENFVYVIDHKDSTTAHVKRVVDTVKVPQEVREVKKTLKKVFELDGYKKLYVLFDDSPSMQDSREYLAKDLASSESNIPVNISGFASQIDTTFSAATPQEAADLLKHMKLIENPDDAKETHGTTGYSISGSGRGATLEEARRLSGIKSGQSGETSQEDARILNKAKKSLEESKGSEGFVEYAVDNALAKIRTIENSSGKELMVVCTDEALQKITKDTLVALRTEARAKNITVQFSILVTEHNSQTNQDEKHIYKLTLDDVEHAYDAVYKGREGIVAEREYQIGVTERQITEMTLQMNNTDRKTAKELKKSIADANEDLVRFKKSLEDAKVITLNKFSNMSKDVIVAEK